jgi:MraZ protein
MHSGTTTTTFDNKGRFSMPTKHRDALMVDGRAPLAITKNPSGHLMLFPKARWDVVMAEMAQWSDDAAEWRSYFMSHYVELEMDAAGRVSIPAFLRDSIGLDIAQSRDAMLIGVGNYFEIWSAERRMALNAALESTPRQERPPEVRSFKF